MDAFIGGVAPGDFTAARCILKHARITILVPNERPDDRLFRRQETFEGVRQGDDVVIQHEQVACTGR